mmetsp:Transcript_16396/g.34276  ORF Transcript_16396/g.34276 Transcript_16396/m.34276 type:complete len:355 (+) Transcript_16396:52-1116(+)
MSQSCRTAFLVALVSQIPWLLLARWFVIVGPFEDWMWQQSFHFCDTSEPAIEPAVNLSSFQMVHVVYTTESRFFPGLLLSMVSLIRHLEDPEYCTVHVVLADEDDKKKASLLKCFESALEGLPRLPQVRFHPYRFDPVFLKLSRYPRRRTHHVTRKPITWARLRLDQYLPNVSRVLYLDTDTIVKSDIGPLFRMHLRFGIAAALDSRLERSKAVPDIKYDLMNFASELNVTYDNYFSSGIMLIDLERWRADKMGSAIERWALKIPSHQPLKAQWHDQDLINVAFRGRVHVLDWRWNAMGVSLPFYFSEQCVDDARILHFTPQRFDLLAEWSWLPSRGGLRMKPYMGPLRVCHGL